MTVCQICGLKRAHIGWCEPCRKSFDQATKRDDGTIQAAIHWAANRARAFALRSRKKAKP